MLDDYIEDEIRRQERDNLVLSWIARAIIITPILIVLALIVKHYLIEPYGVSQIDFEIQVEQIFRGEKGDRGI